VASETSSPTVYVEVADRELTWRFIEAEVDPLGKLAASELASWLIIDSAEGAG
jgi:hypothetical protein